jgi:hypothetical protein
MRGARSPPTAAMRGDMIAFFPHALRWGAGTYPARHRKAIRGAIPRRYELEQSAKQMLRNLGYYRLFTAG